MDSYICQMNERMNKAPEGSCFVVSDFTDIMDYETAKKSIARLEKSGQLRRVIRGIYDKPKYSKLLDEYIAPDVNEIALALARNYNWTIAPSGNTALNFLGLSTQVPANWEYISTGPYRSYEIGKAKLRFSHRSNKTIEGMSPKTAMVIEALKAIGKDSVDEKTVATLQDRLSGEDKERLLSEARQTTNWIYSVIKKICDDVRKQECTK